MLASSAIAFTVYSLLQKPYWKARLRKELTWLFNSTERKPLHAGIAYRNMDNTSASNTVPRCWRGRPWSRRSFRRYILWLHIFNTLPMWASKRSVSHNVIPSNLVDVTCWTSLIGTGLMYSLGLGRLNTISLVFRILISDYLVICVFRLEPRERVWWLQLSSYFC